MRWFVRLLAFAVLALLAALPASAVQPTGSAAWTTNGWATYDGLIYFGPSRGYRIAGHVAAGVRIRVDRCSGLWCQIRVGREHGWFPLDDISFGEFPGGWFRSWPTGPRIAAATGPGTVCFYTGANYRGRSLCLSSGQQYADLSLVGFDNAFSSVRITGSAGALACRDLGFRYYCKIIDASTRGLDRLLNKQITSVKVY
jgi:hypothetical protein